MTDSSNLDLVRSIFARWEHGDYSSVAWAHPQIEFVICDGPSPGTWSGVAGMTHGYREVMNAWEGYGGTAEAYRELDNERVLVLIHLTGRGKTSGVDLAQVQPNGAGIFHVRGDKVTKIVLYWDRDRALADLGLEGQAVSQENVEIVREGYEQFRRRKTFVSELAAPEFAWDMSHFHGWPEQQVYEGVQGADRFLEEWTSAWDDWELQLEELYDAGDKVVAIHRQHGRSRSTGIRADMSFAMVWTLRDGKRTRMEMYSDIPEALKAVGLQGQAVSEEDVEVVRRMYAAGQEVESVVKGGGDLMAHPAMQLFHPECVLEEPAEIPDGATYHGREGIARFFQGVYGEVWDEWRIVPTEIISGPDGVFAAVHNSGRSKSGAEVEMQVFQTFRFRDGMISQATAGFDRAEALKAVGLQE